MTHTAGPDAALNAFRNTDEEVAAASLRAKSRSQTAISKITYLTHHDPVIEYTNLILKVRGRTIEQIKTETLKAFVFQNCTRIVSNKSRNLCIYNKIMRSQSIQQPSV